jgi:hypothetical protein
LSMTLSTIPIVVAMPKANTSTATSYEYSIVCRFHILSLYARVNIDSDILLLLLNLGRQL